MKKLISILLSMFLLLSCSLSVLAAPQYEFGYYIDKVEYIGNNLAEATIVFTSQYGSDADMGCIGFLAVYDDITKSYLNVSYQGYNEYKPFLDKQRYEVKQTVEIPDLTKLRYNFKFFVWDSTDNIKPEGFVDLGNNSYILKKDDFTAKNTYYIETKIPQYSLEPEDTRLAISVLKYDDNFINDFPYGTKIVVINNSDKINLTDYVGLLCNMTVYYDEEADDFILKDISVNTKKNNIISVNPMLYQGISQSRICYYSDENKKTWCNHARVEYPFNAYINGIMMASCYNEENITLDLEMLGIVTDDMRKRSSNNKSYKFADTDNNGLYDTLLVENNASFVVDKIIDGVEFYVEDSKSVYNSSFEFNTYETYEFFPAFYIGGKYTSYKIHDTFGREVLNSDIKKGDVLTVKMSSDGQYRYYDIIVSNNTVTGSISEVYRGEDAYTPVKYVINGNAYVVNASMMGDNMEAGVNGVFTLTPDGKIIKADLEDDFEYGIVTSTLIENTPYSCTAKVQMLTSQGERKLYNYADELKINDQYINTSRPETVYMLCSIIPGSFVYYKTDENGEIYYITTYEDFTDKYIMEKADCITTYKETRGKLNGKVILDNTPIWCIAENGNIYNANSYVFADKSVLEDGSQYRVRIIWENETNEAKLVLISNLALEDDTEEILTSNYGVVVAASLSSDATSTGANGLSFMIIDENGDMKIYSSTNDIEIDNVPYYNNGVAVANTASGGTGGTAPGTSGGSSSESFVIPAGTTVLYETNENGQIKNIYTASSSINEKDDTLGILSVSGKYINSKISDITLTDNTPIVCIEDEKYISAYALYNSASLNNLDSDTVYDVSFIYDVETMEAKFAFIKNLYVEKTEKLTRNYGILINSVVENNSFEPRRSAQIIGTDGTAKVYYFTSSFNVNGTGYMEDYSDATASTPFVFGEAVVFETNEDGQIRNIYTDKYSVNDGFDDIGLAYITNEKYKDGKISEYTVDETTVIIGCENSTTAATGSMTDASSYSKYDVSYLNETQGYNGTIIYNSETGKAVMFYITDFMIAPDYASAPMVVESVSEVYSDGQMRDKITGYVNGERVSYTLSWEDDVVKYDIRGFETPHIMVRPGEAFWFIANEKNQILSMRMIVQNYTYSTPDGSSTMSALAALKPTDMINNNIDNDYIPAVLVDLRTGNDILDGNIYNMVGHAGIGKVNEKFEGEMDLFINTNLADNSMLQNDSNLITVYYNENTPAYFYGWDYEKPIVSTLSSVKSFEELGCIYDKLWGGAIAEKTSSCEDIVYVYTYNGKNVFNYVFDPNNNSN